MRILDLYCGAGFAAEGYRQAGFEIIGVDLEPQPRYPFAYIQHDALSLDIRFLRSFDAVHASPPCQFGTSLRFAPGAKVHVNLIPPTRRMLERAGVPYVIENVDSPEVRKHMISPIMLCGSMFGLGAHTQGGEFHQFRRHRLFETSFPLTELVCEHHDGPTIGVYGGHVRNRAAGKGGRGTSDYVGEDRGALARQAMGVEWGTMNELSQGIPPAFTRWIGDQLIYMLNHKEAAA